jgi:hypothetical protein
MLAEPIVGLIVLLLLCFAISAICYFPQALHEVLSGKPTDESLTIIAIVVGEVILLGYVWRRYFRKSRENK